MNDLVFENGKYRLVAESESEKDLRFLDGKILYRYFNDKKYALQTIDGQVGLALLKSVAVTKTLAAILKLGRSFMSKMHRI